MRILENDYINWIISEGMANSNIPYQRSIFREFKNFCAERSIQAESINTEVSRSYMTILAKRPNKQNKGELLSTSTRAKHYDFLTRFGVFLKDKNIISDPGITMGIRRPHPRHTSIQSFSQVQLQAILDAVKNVRTSSRFQERTALLIFTLASTGLRISELLPLKPINFDFDRRTVLVVGKGNIEREVPYSVEISYSIQGYIDKYNISRTDYLFASRYGRPLAASSVRDVLRSIKKLLGVKHGIDRMRVSPHTFRHTFARSWVVKGGNTIALSRILGHANTQMTDRYVRLWGVDLNKAYDLCNPCSDISLPKFDNNM